jgi:NADH-quinone oxidoreductase subunit D
VDEQPSATATAALGAGARDLTTSDVVLHLGHAHPSTHGALRLVLTLDGERIVAAEPVIGYMHRGAEKLFEVRDYRQGIVLANRHDWLSAFSNELGLVMAVERLLGLEVPPRAVWLRTLLAELNRVANHLMFLAADPFGDGAGGPRASGGPVPPGLRERERLLGVLEEASGGRVHYMLNRVGGLKEDVPAGWVDRARGAVAGVRHGLPDVEEALLGDEGFRERTVGVGVLPVDLVETHGMSGPVARASGADADLRRDDPYLAYGDLGFGTRFPVVTRREGDCFARYACLVEQVRVSLDLADACLDALPGGPVDVRLSKNVRAPEGHVYCWTENPLGVNGYYLVSRGERTPYRLKLRTASFNNVAALPRLLPGVLLRDLAAVLASLFFVTGDLDK